ncbi:Mov34/MPN/PAD-1 family protein [Aquibacillus koreensis]|uniref:Mov34/MPN/PAD-1 family protein n=1 Tax=Aquibacillus koreensis TaxID=279446 RepID=A0A9X3WJR4_9BACI|nr:Mov34/MPN/PAD-1 family protein [Aquibacillus koreensis]MCT2536302.1 Mov34/MPN/PAD-1 family protein [Aquibacillus koreensis]MDC3421347.1 Mov34/MPN/PAD-1 family protein [Aquibacillus koreensis]
MSDKDIIIPQSIYSELIEKNRDLLPFEGCGILSGSNRYVKTAWYLDNELRSPNRFFVNKQIVEDTVMKIQEKQEDILAVYHTHPNTSAIPSSLDLKNHIDNEIDMVIISFKYKEPILKWYSIHGVKYAERLFLIDKL